MTETLIYERELQVAQTIARQAGAIMIEHFDGNQQTEHKKDGSPVTIADKKINTMVINELQKSFPADRIIGEEESTAGYGPGRKWFCDPIDGTIAYTWGVPTSMFSLGLVKDGQPQMGVVYDPYLDRLYRAEKGSGSYCNDQPIHVSDLPLDGGVVAITSNVKRISNGLEYVRSLTDSPAHLATFSGAIYKAVLVAKGRFVGYIEHGVNAHDMAAVHVIVEEAGGKITDTLGNQLDYAAPFKGSVVSNGVVHDQLVAIAKE